MLLEGIYEISEKEFFKKLFSSHLISKPEEKFSYSNVGYSVLGKIIELTSGQSYKSYLNEYFFTPLGMKQTGYLLPQWDSAQLSHSYNRGILESESSIVRYRDAGQINWHLKANGGINSTQNDMLLWCEALQKNKVLSKKSMKLLSTPFVNYPSGTISYSYGWMVQTLKNKMKRIAHNGSNGAYSHSILWYPEEKLYILYATNANSDEVEFLAYFIAKMIFDESYSPQAIKDNVYSFSVNYINQHATGQSDSLISLLKERYSEEYDSPRFLNSMGNLLLMLNQNFDWALELFKINVQRFPEDGNLWDSLGDAYIANKQKNKAIESYQKAVELGFDGSKEKLENLLDN